MSSFIEELLEIAAAIIPEADVAEIDPKTKRAIRLSWKTNDDPSRPNKRFQPVVIELRNDFTDLPNHVSSELREEFSSFIRNKRKQFKPRTTDNPEKPHTADYWIFPPED